ncbi:MAG TPA: hypothetical protein VEL76_18070, partial [Gemmataceae bacterium]|nr:hypothetical protein [Gemmataceae bacterium]
PAVLSAESMTVIVRAGVAWGTATRETIAPAAAAVAEGVIRAMSMKRIAIVFGLILTLGSLGLGAAVLARPGTADEPTVSVARAVPIGPQADKDALPAALRRLIAESDGIVVAETPEPGKPEFRVKRVLKGQLLVGEPVNVNRIAGMDTLPAVNAGKEWLLFLRIVEDDLAHPEVYPVMARGWLRPASAELVRRVRDAIPPPRVWEPEQNWLRLGLALRQPRFQPGEDIVAEVWLQNLRQEEFPVLHLRYNIYDYWRDTRFEVKGPDGRKWILEKPVGKMQEADFPYTKKLQPGETYIHTIRLNRWPVSRGEIQKYAANLFVEPGTYTIQCIYEYALAKGPWWALRSAPVQWELPRALLGEGRLKDLRRNLDHSQVWVTLQPDEPPNKWNVNYELRHVSLEVPLTLREPPGIGPTGKPVSAGVRIPKEQAAQIVDVLARAGYFDRALTLLAVAPDVKGRSAEIAVSHGGTNPPTQYRLILPWGRPMLRQLEALRACVDGEAGRLLDRLLLPIQEESKKWPAAPMP